MPAKLLAALVLALACLSARADGLPPNVLKALKAAQIPAASVAVVVQPVDSNSALVAHNSSQAMNPASVVKLVTTYAALDLLGPAYTWKTTAWIDVPPVDGVLNGNLYLKGSGDPRFAIEHLSGLLRQLRVRGIRHIAGDVVLDRTVFNVPSIDPGAFDDKPMRPYNVGPDGLLINFRALRFTLLPDNGRAAPAAGNAQRRPAHRQPAAGRQRRVRQQLEGRDRRPPDPGKQRQPPRIHRQLPDAVRREAVEPLAAAGRCPGRRPDPRAVEGTRRHPRRPGARRHRAGRRQPARPA